VLDATFSRPDLDAFCRLDTLGLTVVGQQLDGQRAVLACHVRDPVEQDRWCRGCGGAGRVRDSVVRRLAHVPFGWRPTVLLVRLRRYACTGCGRVWREDLSSAAPPRGKLSRDAVLWALKSLVLDRLSVARIAAALAVAWHTVNDAVLTAGRELLIADPTRLDGVEVIGVDEHCWRHPRGHNSHQLERFVTVIIDLTPVRDGTGPARLLDLVEGRSKAVFRAWLQAQTPAFRAGLQVVAMDGFTGFKTATTEALPQATAVMDPFHVVALAGDALERCRQRVQQDTLGHRGRKGDPLYALRRRLRTGADLLTRTHLDRIDAVLGQEQHLAVAVTWSVYQRVVAAYRQPDRARGKAALSALIDSLRRGVPAALPELVTLGRTLSRRAADVLAYFDRPGTSNGPTEAINGRLEHLRGTALGFRNLTHYMTRALLDCGGFRPALHRLLR
jgi:transposase